MDIGKHELITLRDPVVIRRIRKGQRQDSGVDQVCRMNAGKGLGNHHTNAEIKRYQRGMLSGGTLSVVLPTYDDAAAGLFGTRRERLITDLEAVLRQMWNIRTVR